MAKKKVTKKPEIKVNEELELLLPPLSDNEVENLERSLLRSNGPLNPIWLWKGTIVDGHNRYKACRKLDLPFDTKDVWPDAKDIDEVKFLMKEAACGQRNMPDEVTSRFRAQMVRYLVEKENKPVKEAVSHVAKSAGVSERQIQRDMAKSKTIDGMHPSCAKADAVWKLSDNQTKQLELLTHEEQHALIERAGYEAKGIKGELRRMAKVEGSPLQKATAKKAEKRAKSREERETARQMLDTAIDALADFQKRAISARRKLGVTEKKWDIVRHLITKLDDVLASWKQAADETK
ncbi:MAG: hypothetical protein AAFV88_11635 [Planctomycetota bacterium]